MSTPLFLSIPVVEESQPGLARREAARLSALVGMSESDAGRVSILVTEAANNLLKHGSGGEVLLRGSRVDGVGIVEVLALDKGRGMGDVGACMRDGFSTAGTSGTGLGAMQRISDLLDIYSQPGNGTVVYSRVISEKVKPAHAVMDCGVVVVPFPGETRSGDGWAEHHTESHSVYLVVDGLGHGHGAAEAADEAVDAFTRVATINPLDALDEIHHSLRKTRGAAASIASIDRNARKVRFAGVGNVAGAVLTETKSHSMVSHNGILGHTIPRVQDFTYDWPLGATLALYSDGISSHWNLMKFPGLSARSPMLGAAVIYRDYSRRRDDATVLLVREHAARE